MEIPLIMVRATLLDLPRVTPPDGFSVRRYRHGEREVWAQIETAAGEFSTVDAALAHFEKEFGAYEAEMESRCLFAVDGGSGRPVATATAWYDANRGPEWGRLHWVGADREYHGRGLGRVLVGLALSRLAEDHSKACLTTQTTSVAAVKIYLDFGFRPSFEQPTCLTGWRVMRSLLDHPGLSDIPLDSLSDA